MFFGRDQPNPQNSAGTRPGPGVSPRHSNQAEQPAATTRYRAGWWALSPPPRLDNRPGPTQSRASAGSRPKPAAPRLGRRWACSTAQISPSEKRSGLLGGVGVALFSPHNQSHSRKAQRFYPPGLWDYPMAWARSSIRSSASSMPTLRRMSESLRPDLRRCSAGMLACVMVAGWPERLSTPPRLSARVKY